MLTYSNVVLLIVDYFIIGMKKCKEWQEEPLGTMSLIPDQFQTVAALLASDWCQKTLCFSA